MRINSKFKSAFIAKSILASLLLVLLASGNAQAQSSTTTLSCVLAGTCTVKNGVVETIQDIYNETVSCDINPSPLPSSCCTCATTEANLKKYMNIHRQGDGLMQNSFLFKTFWDDTVNPGLQKALSKVIQGTVNQNTGLGTFMEAKNNIQSISSLQEGSAQTARDYLPSEQLCRFGSLGQSLGADDMKSRAAQQMIARGGLSRNSGATGSVAAAGASDEVSVRMDEVIKESCNGNDPAMTLMCGTNTQRRFPNVAKDTRYNGDINYMGTIDANATINADFVAGDELTPAQQDVISLSQNLYGHKQPSSRITEGKIRKTSGQDAYIKSRSVIASRSVPLNSYAAIAGMRMRGSGGARPYMKAVLTQLGIGPAQVETMLSDKPSYYAQMGVLTKNLYQEPSFYANLMEGKTNVVRQSSAMEGLELMQDRDIYNSMRRSEMLLALLVQLQAKGETK